MVFSTTYRVAEASQLGEYRYRHTPSTSFFHAAPRHSSFKKLREPAPSEEAPLLPHERGPLHDVDATHHGRSVLTSPDTFEAKRRADITSTLEASSSCRLGQLCIVEAGVTGQPVRFRSNGFEVGSRGLKVGTCQFLGLPYKGESQYLSTSLDRESRPLFHLEDFLPLREICGARSEFGIASRVDLTSFIKCLASSGRKVSTKSAKRIVGKTLASDIDWSAIAKDDKLEVLDEEMSFLGRQYGLAEEYLNLAAPAAEDDRYITEASNILSVSREQSNKSIFAVFVRSHDTHLHKYFVLKPCPEKSKSGGIRPFRRLNRGGNYCVVQASPSLLGPKKPDLLLNFSQSPSETLVRLQVAMDTNEDCEEIVHWGRDGIKMVLVARLVTDGRQQADFLSRRYICFLIAV